MKMSRQGSTTIKINHKAAANRNGRIMQQVSLSVKKEQATERNKRGFALKDKTCNKRGK
jgi:hypothetical protein